MKQIEITPQIAARRARERLRALADPVKAAGAERYFKETIRSYGVSSAEVRALAAALGRTVQEAWTVDDAVALCDILLRDKELEAKAVGFLILGRFKNSFGPGLFPRAKRWFAGNLLDNWASVDIFCSEVMSPFLEKHPAFSANIKSWARHPNRWVKRASLVSFVAPARRGRFLDAVYEISSSVLDVDDDLIHKANGWLLREAGKTDSARLEKFLLARGPALPRTTLRYAIERFPEVKRKRLLLSTKI
ncbi:MAG: DNA alkylation repair protein [Candidatus Aminicenantes bacterium]|nr:DNA alkylation repair protein [Candidatus Aminicenantes bacterium]